MFNIDPKWRFFVQLGVFICVGISQGAVHLTHMIPDGWIPVAIAWAGFIAFVGTGATTILSGFGMTSQSRIAAAASLPDVKAIVTTQDTAQAAPSTKVVSTIAAAQAVSDKAA